MAHTKAAGSAKRTVDVAGKRLGIKKFAGQYVKSGNIIVRQHGSSFYPGVGTEQGRDFTIFAVAPGVVRFRGMTGYKRNQKYVDVIPAEKPAVKAKKTPVAKEESVEKAPAKAKVAKKPAAKKTAKK